MPLDLSAINPNAGKNLTEPRDIFASLGNKPWPRLRVEQDQVLKAWFDRRAEGDLVIKQNTGGGKTVVGLLVAQSSLNEGTGPAAYLVPDNYLVAQVVDEANRIGLTVTTDAKSNDFLSSNAILVCTFDKVVNGRTVFRLAGDPYARTIGTLVVDDAHAALSAARKQFTLDIPPEHPAYSKAISVFGDELKRQSMKNAAALITGDRSAPLRIPFWTWSDKYQIIADEIAATPKLDDYPGIYYSWPLVADNMKLAVATISSRRLQVRTPCPPIDLIPAFHQARRRVYLTATLSDDGVLVTDLGADPSSARRPISPERATDLGDRLILAPGALNPQVIDDTIRSLARDFSVGNWNGDSAAEAKPINVVVLVPSDRAAGPWKPYAQAVLHVRDMKPYIDRMSAGEHLGLIVLVNKYDGVDLPHDACRLLVIDGIPTPLDPGEQREAGALAGSETYRIRNVQRLEQGMGRGIRDAEDHCAVLLLGSALALSLVDPADLKHFSPATQAQIKLSHSIAAQIKGEGLGPVRDALTKLLERNQAWKDLSSSATAGVAYDTDGHVSAIAEARRKAWDLAAAGDPGAAAKTLRDALDGTSSIERGWWLEEVAAYQHEVDPPGAQATIKAAKQANKNTLMPTIALAARPVKGRALQAEAASEYLSEHYSDGTSLQLKVQSILDDLDFDPDQKRVDAAEAAMRDLGLHLGFTSTRPEKEAMKGPDICWGLTPTANAVIELKTGTERADTDIVKSEADQLSGALAWNDEINDTTDCVPVLVAKSARLHKLASAPRGTRVITPETLAALKDHVRMFVVEIAHDRAWQRPEAVAAALQRHDLTASNVISKHTLKIEPADR